MRNQYVVDQLPDPVVDPGPVRRAFARHRVTGGHPGGQVPQPVAVAQVRLVEPSGAQLGTWRPKQDLGGGGLRGVVEVAADNHVAFLSVALQLVGGPRPDGDGLGGLLMQSVQAEAGAFGLVARLEAGLLGATAGEGQQLGLQVSGEGLHRQAVTAGVGDR